MIEHLLPARRLGQENLGRGLAERGDGGFAGADADAALCVLQLHDAIKHDQPRRLVRQHFQRPVGAADGSGRGRRLDIDAGPAGGGARPDASRIQLQFRRAVFRQCLDRQLGIAVHTDHGLVREAQRQRARRPRAQRIAG